MSATKLLPAQESTSNSTINSKEKKPRANTSKLPIKRARNSDSYNKDLEKKAKYQQLLGQNQALRKVVKQKDIELNECLNKMSTLEEWMKAQVNELTVKIEGLKQRDGKNLTALLEMIQEGITIRDKNIQTRIEEIENKLPKNSQENWIEKEIPKSKDTICVEISEEEWSKAAWNRILKKG
ncbi:unnamed protein product [Blepharisma stoltei]|uniref:Uncharacterized protein n=1 Tax=Blepharisma stoltei TaxID=1481888 RepID=A0AAU9JUQ7_9CILI|nr:unnamed protein product [Blepharisma stoltei]